MRDANPNLQYGYFKLWRSFFDHEIWTSKPESWARVALVLLKSANHRPKTWFDGKQNVTIPRGSCVVSLPKLGESARATREQVRKSLRYLQETGFITQTRTHPYRVISVTNYCTYQGSDVGENIPENTPENTGENIPGTYLEHLKNTPETPTKKERIKEEKKEDLPAFGLAESGCESNGWKARFFNQEFWPIVWKKSDKADAEKAFNKFATNLGKAEWLKQKAIEQGPLILAEAQKRKSTPLYPASWINGRRYEDDWGEKEDEGLAW